MPIAGMGRRRLALAPTPATTSGEESASHGPASYVHSSHAHRLRHACTMGACMCAFFYSLHVHTPGARTRGMRAPCMSVPCRAWWRLMPSNVLLCPHAAGAPTRAALPGRSLRRTGRPGLWSASSTRCGDIGQLLLCPELLYAIRVEHPCHRAPSISCILGFWMPRFAAASSCGAWHVMTCACKCAAARYWVIVTTHRAAPATPHPVPHASSIVPSNATSALINGSSHLTTVVLPFRGSRHSMRVFVDLQDVHNHAPI